MLKPERPQKASFSRRTVPKASGAGIGAYLSRQRRLRGIELSELSAQTRIPVRSLKRLEEGAFDTTADGFARGFVRTVAQALGLDSNEAVARMLAEPEISDRAKRFGKTAGRTVAVAIVAVVVLVLAGFATHVIFDSIGGRPGTVVLRRDPVRSLYAEQALRLPDSGARAVSTSPSPGRSSVGKGPR